MVKSQRKKQSERNKNETMEETEEEKKKKSGFYFAYKKKRAAKVTHIYFAWNMFNMCSPICFVLRRDFLCHVNKSYRQYLSGGKLFLLLYVSCAFFSSFVYILFILLFERKLPLHSKHCLSDFHLYWLNYKDLNQSRTKLRKSDNDSTYTHVIRFWRV